MPTDEDPRPFKLKERFVWLWHPHFWLTAAVVVLVLLLLAWLAG